MRCYAMRGERERKRQELIEGRRRRRERERERQTRHKTKDGQKRSNKSVCKGQKGNEIKM